MKSLKMKDFVFLAIICALYFVLYMVTMLLITPLGAFGHVISPGIFGLLGGTIIYFIQHRLGKMWQFTIMSVIIMLIFTLVGGGYLPWLITTVTTAFIADLLVSRNASKSTLMLAISFGIMQIGQALGGIAPVWFFVEQYRSEWIARGQTPEHMDAQIAAAQGMMGFWAILIVFVLAFIGVYIGQRILKKHFANYENE